MHVMMYTVKPWHICEGAIFCMDHARLHAGSLNSIDTTCSHQISLIPNEVSLGVKTVHESVFPLFAEIAEMLPGILNQLGTESLSSLRKLASSVANGQYTLASFCCGCLVCIIA